MNNQLETIAAPSTFVIGNGGYEQSIEFIATNPTSELSLSTAQSQSLPVSQNSSNLIADGKFQSETDQQNTDQNPVSKTENASEKPKTSRKRKVFSPPAVRMTWRTLQLLENKKKTEEAFVQNLPISVSEQKDKIILEKSSKVSNSETDHKKPKTKCQSKFMAVASQRLELLQKAKNFQNPLPPHISDSLRFFTIQAIESVFTSFNKLQIPEKACQIIQNYLNQHAFKDQYLEYDLPLNFELASGNDYRGLMKELKTAMTTKSTRFHRKEQHRPRGVSFPPFRCTGPLFINSAEITGAELIEKAKDWGTKKLNQVYDVKIQAKLPSGSSAIVEQDRNDYYQLGNNQLNAYEGFESNRLPVPVLTVKNLTDAMDSRLASLVKSSSICMIRGLGQAIKLNFDLFDIKILAAKRAKDDMIVMRQMPQCSRENRDVITGKKRWETNRYTGSMKMKEFSDKYDELKDVVARALKNMKTSHEFELTVQKLQEDVQRTQMEVVARGVDHRVAWATFGTNINLDKSKYPVQAKEIEKFPNFMRPDGKDTLLNFTEEIIAGLNGVQVYVKPPGVRTPAHLENSGLDSINMNLGPGTCVWYSIPFEFSGQMESLLSKKGLTPWNSFYWPDEDELLRAGIPVQKFLQEKDDTVYVGTGTWHWVQSNGFCTNIAWNVAQPCFKQLAITALIHDHTETAKATFMNTLVAIEPMVWNIARVKKFADDADTFELVKTIMARSLANVQFELDWLKSQNIMPVPKEECTSVKLPKVIRCYDCEKVIFNFFTTHAADNSTIKIYCSRCATKLNGKTGNEHQPDKCYYQHSVENLINIFDEYQKV